MKQGVVVVVVACFVAAGCVSLPPAVDGPHGVRAVRSGHALFYVVPVDDGGVVLVDTGFDSSGADVVAAAAGRPIRAVLITHSHVDHWSGVHVVGDAPVFAGPRDVEAMRGLRHHRGCLNYAADFNFPRPQLPADLRAVDDGVALELGGETFTPVVLPGHTAGSVVWLWRDVAFTGDAVMIDGDGLGLAPAVVSDDVRQARRSVSKLWGVDVEVILDGHTGRGDHAQARLQRFLREHDEP